MREGGDECRGGARVHRKRRSGRVDGSRRHLLHRRVAGSDYGLCQLSRYLQVPACCGVFAREDQDRRAQSGFGGRAWRRGRFSSIEIVAGAFLDIVLGAALIVRRWTHLTLSAMLVLSLVYLIVASLLHPALWADPLGRLVKTIPVLLLMLFALATLDERCPTSFSRSSRSTSWARRFCSGPGSASPISCGWRTAPAMPPRSPRRRVSSSSPTRSSPPRRWWFSRSPASFSCTSSATRRSSPGSCCRSCSTSRSARAGCRWCGSSSCYVTWRARRPGAGS